MKNLKEVFGSETDELIDQSRRPTAALRGLITLDEELVLVKREICIEV